MAINSIIVACRHAIESKEPIPVIFSFFVASFLFLASAMLFRHYCMEKGQYMGTTQCRGILRRMGIPTPTACRFLPPAWPTTSQMTVDHMPRKNPGWLPAAGAGVPRLDAARKEWK
jgi:hypothetical protein